MKYSKYVIVVSGAIKLVPFMQQSVLDNSNPLGLHCIWSDAEDPSTMSKSKIVGT